jgi:hypothetical protein
MSKGRGFGFLLLEDYARDDNANKSYEKSAKDKRRSFISAGKHFVIFLVVILL